MAYVPITDAELTADKPITQALLRKFRDNLEAHSHQSGQGGTLVGGSFADGSLPNYVFADRTIESNAISINFTVVETSVEVTIGSFFNTASSSFWKDPLAILEFTPERPSLYMIQWVIGGYVKTTATYENMTIEAGIVKNNQIIDESRIGLRVPNIALNYCLSPISGFYLYETADLSRQTIELYLKSSTTSFSNIDMVVNQRHIIMREFAL